MTEDHETRLAALAEKLADVFLVEANPDEWNGAGQKPAALTKEARGDRQWDLKNANQVGLLFARALELRQRVKWVRQADEGGDATPPPTGTLGPVQDPDADIKRFEAEATAVLGRLRR